MPPLLTASLIVRDEAEVLEACLESIRDVVDEIVIVDTGSIDATREIARRFGASLYEFPWNGSFADARNAALDRSHGDWILYIDADERLHPVGRETVEQLLRHAPEVAFRVLLSPQTGMTPYREYRLWRNDPRIRFEGAMHEKVVSSIHWVSVGDGKPIGDCDLLLRHVGYDGDQTRKHRRNLGLLRRQMESEPDNLFNLHHMARVLAGLGATAAAEEMLWLTVERARTMPSDGAGALGFTDLVALLAAREEDVADLLEEALAKYPANWCLAWERGRHLLRTEQYDHALACFDEFVAVDVAKLPDQDGPSYDERLFTELAHEARGLCLFRLGRYKEAADAYARAAGQAPEELSYRVKRDLALAKAGPGARGPGARSTSGTAA